MLLWVSAPSVPPVTVKSALVRSVVASDTVKVSVVLAPAAKVAVEPLMATVGVVVSTVMFKAGLWPLSLPVASLSV